MSQLERKKRRTKHLLHDEIQCSVCNEWFKSSEIREDGKCWRCTNACEPDHNIKTRSWYPGGDQYFILNDD